MSFTVASCVRNLPAKFGNRLDLVNFADGSKPIIAVQQAIGNLTESYEFEELKYQTPVPPITTLALTTGNPVVTIASLLATIPANAAAFPQFQNQNFIDVTDIYTMWLWFTGGVNQAGRTLDYRRVPVIDQDSYGITSSQQGSIGTAPPVYYTRFGSILQVGPVPDNNYQFFVRVKLRHPFPFVGEFLPAVLSLTIAAGVITAVNVISGGIGYLPNLTNIPLTFTAPVGGGAMAAGTATSNGSGVITSAAVSIGGSGYFAGSAFTGTAAIAQQSVFTMDSWQEIIEYAACWRLATWEGATEYVEMFQATLKNYGVDVAKAFEARSQMKRDERHNSRSISLQLGSPYTYARR